MLFAYFSMISLILLQSLSIEPNYIPQYTLSSGIYNNFNYISFAPKSMTNMFNKLVNTVLCVNGSTFIFIYIEDKVKKNYNNRNILD